MAEKRVARVAESRVARVCSCDRFANLVSLVSFTSH